MSNSSELSGWHLLADFSPKMMLRKVRVEGQTSEFSSAFATSNIKLVGGMWFAYWSQEEAD